MNMNILTLYFTHDTSIAFFHEGKYISLELERWTKQRYCGFINFTSNEAMANAARDLFKKVKEYIDITYGPIKFDCIYHNVPLKQIPLYQKPFGIFLSVFNCYENRFIGHHLAHASTAFYTSPFDKALCFSYDGGGNERERGPVIKTTYCIMDRNGPLPEMNGGMIVISRAFGLIYTIFFCTRFPIFKENIPSNSLKTPFLSMAGKFMGLAGCGKSNPKSVSLFESFFALENERNPEKETLLKEKLFNLHPELKKDHEGGDENLRNKIPFESWANLAASIQEAFQNQVLACFDPIIRKYPDLPICIGGGCGLNVKMNSIIKEKYKRPVFVPCCPNDSGIALGVLFSQEKPKTQAIVTYNNFPLLNKSLLPTYVQEEKGTKYSYEQLALLIKEGKAIATVIGNSECGPRALGNRSILAKATTREMFNKINHEIKFRESYRPLAPVCRLEDVSKYFEFEGESPFMNFAPLVREEYRKLLPAITHFDNTARVQTVTREQHSFLYDLLTALEKLGEIPVIINTSFNSKGKPIVADLKDAFTTFKETKLDALVVEEYLFIKE